MRDVLATALVSAVVSVAMVFVLRMATGREKGTPAGGAQVDVPSLVGLKADQARQLLEQRGLLLELVEQVDDSRYEPGSISDQLPLAASSVARGSSIRAKVVRAGEQARVPTVVGRPEAEARAMLEAVHLKVGARSMQPDPSVAPGAVMATTPAAGASVSAGGTVDVVVSTGPAAPAGAVPKVTGRSLEKAQDALTRAGYELGAVQKGRDEDVEHGQVLRQTPAAGTPAPKGAKVDLVVNDTE